WVVAGQPEISGVSGALIKQFGPIFLSWLKALHLGITD
ncbi:hypothetical protein PSYJA_05419, partial [Pseudomonas syringae pv. japonica str. M301072]